jgi:hypothetical protein
MLRALALALFVGILTSTGCTEQRKQQTGHVNIDPSKATKIRLFADGRLELNGKTASLDEVTNHLQKQTGIPGAHVLYYRESSAGEPPSAWKPIMEAVVSARLPIRISTKPGF